MGNYFWVQNCTFELKLVQTFSSTTLSVHFKQNVVFVSAFNSREILIHLT